MARVTKQWQAKITLLFSFQLKTKWTPIALKHTEWQQLLMSAQSFPKAPLPFLISCSELPRALSLLPPLAQSVWKFFPAALVWQHLGCWTVTGRTALEVHQEKDLNIPCSLQHHQKASWMQCVRPWAIPVSQPLSTWHWGTEIVHWRVFALAPLPWSIQCLIPSPFCYQEMAQPTPDRSETAWVKFKELISRLAREGGTEIISSGRTPSLGQVIPEPAAAGEGSVPMGAIPSSPSPAPGDPVQFLKLLEFYCTSNCKSWNQRT